MSEPKIKTLTDKQRTLKPVRLKRLLGANLQFKYKLKTMNDITEKTNAEVSITLDNVEEGTPVSVFFFILYGEEKNKRIEMTSYIAPAKGQAQAAILNTNEVDLNGADKKAFKVEIWSNIDSESQQLEIRDNVNIVDARAV